MSVLDNDHKSTLFRPITLYSLKVERVQESGCYEAWVFRIQSQHNVQVKTAINVPKMGGETGTNGKIGQRCSNCGKLDQRAENRNKQL